MVIFILYFPTRSHGQTSTIRSLVDSLGLISENHLDCSSRIYWQVVAKGKLAIPILIDKLNDTTKTNVSFSCKNAALNVGEVAYLALNEIAELPIFVITQKQFDVVENGCWNFYKYLFDNKNKPHFQELVRNWYSINQSNFEMKRIPVNTLSNCQIQYKISSRMIWKG